MNELGGIKWHTTGVGVMDMDVEGTTGVEGGDLGKRALYYRGSNGSGGINWNADWDYWSTQVPLVRSVRASVENKRYWEDYYRNTGFRPKYPSRAYGYTTRSLLGDSSLVSSWVISDMKRIYG